MSKYIKIIKIIKRPAQMARKIICKMNNRLEKKTVGTNIQWNILLLESSFYSWTLTPVNDKGSM